MTKNQTEDTNRLKCLIERLHHCTGTYIEEVAVIEKYGPKTVWEGIVHVFEITGHPQTDKCYAWYSDMPETGTRKYYAVLGIPPIDSPEKAVRASIVYDHKGKTNKEK